MSDVAIIDVLNRHIRFDAQGHVTQMDKAAAVSALDRMQHRALAAELRRCIEQSNFSDNRLVSVSDHAERAGVMVALMSTPYVKDAQDRRLVCLHAVRFEDIETLAPLRARYPAPNIRPVAMTEATAHIRDVLRFVALFPDSILGEIPEGYADGFYFREKFVEAFETRIRPLLDRLWTPGSFANLRSASQEDLRLAAAIWVHLHEHFHCSSPLPIDLYPKLKGSRLAGAFEELRVDLCAAGADLGSVMPATMERVVFEFILAFRLVYYGSSFEPTRDYDAITSVALGNALLEDGWVRQTASGLYEFNDAADLRAGLNGVLARFSDMEDRQLARIESGAGSEQEQLDLRVAFEQMMLRLCDASEQGAVRRNTLLRDHATALQGLHRQAVAVG